MGQTEVHSRAFIPSLRQISQETKQNVATLQVPISPRRTAPGSDQRTGNPGEGPSFLKRSLQKRALTFYGPWAQREGGGRAGSGVKPSQREERWLGPGPW